MNERCHALATTVQTALRETQSSANVHKTAIDPVKQVKVCEVIAALEGCPASSRWPSKNGCEMVRLLMKWVDQHYATFADLKTTLGPFMTPEEVQYAATALSVVLFAVVHEADAYERAKYETLATSLGGVTV